MPWARSNTVAGPRIETVFARRRDADDLDPWAVGTRLTEPPPERVLPEPQQIDKPAVNDRHRAGPLVVCLSETASALDWYAQSGKVIRSDDVLASDHPLSGTDGLAFGRESAARSHVAHGNRERERGVFDTPNVADPALCFVEKRAAEGS